jgi:hypothetical protein
MYPDPVERLADIKLSEDLGLTNSGKSLIN